MSDTKKHPGQPMKFKTVEDLQNKIDDYFQWADDNEKPLTIGRLCCFLDCDRRTLLNYNHNDKFFPTIKKARQKIEASKEEHLQSGRQVAGIIFDLKNNHGWKDTKDLTNDGGKFESPVVNVTLDD